MTGAKLVAVVTFALCAATPAAHAGTLTTLYTFQGQADGALPVGTLVYRGGALFGASYGTYHGKAPYGNVFKINPKSGHFEIVYSFKGGADGASPTEGVIYQGGTLYGTTSAGGSGCTNSGCGTIYSVNPKTGVETVLYSFPQDPGGGGPGPSGLIYVAGTFFGSTSYGGANGDGSIFSYSQASGSFTTLHNFGGVDGIYPNPGFLYENGLFYGTTVYGGTGVCHLGGCGTLFAINPTTGAETVIRSFGKKDGKYPMSNLAYYAGSVIGDTSLGGNQACQRGCGVSYKIKATTGRETVLEDFASWNESYSGITVVGDNAYETLPGDGTTSYGQLVEFNLNSGQQTVLYTFSGGADGRDPVEPLIYHNGVFYGTTLLGGIHDGCGAEQGCGTVFKYVP